MEVIIHCFSHQVEQSMHLGWIIVDILFPGSIKICFPSKTSFGRKTIYGNSWFSGFLLEMLKSVKQALYSSSELKEAGYTLDGIFFNNIVNYCDGECEHCWHLVVFELWTINKILFQENLYKWHFWIALKKHNII